MSKKAETENRNIINILIQLYSLRFNKKDLKLKRISLLKKRIFFILTRLRKYSKKVFCDKKYEIKIFMCCNSASVFLDLF